MTGGTQTADFIYGADGQRVVQAIGTSGGSALSRTVYVGLGATRKSIYERTTSGGKIEHAHFIYAGTAHGGSALAIRTVPKTLHQPRPGPSTVTATSTIWAPSLRKVTRAATSRRPRGLAALQASSATTHGAHAAAPTAVPPIPAAFQPPPATGASPIKRTSRVSASST